MDYVIVGAIAILALLYIIRHVRSTLKGKEAGPSCGGCGGSCCGGNTQKTCGETPFPVIEGKKTE